MHLVERRRTEMHLTPRLEGTCILALPPHRGVRGRPVRGNCAPAVNAVPFARTSSGASNVQSRATTARAHVVPVQRPPRRRPPASSDVRRAPTTSTSARRPSARIRQAIAMSTGSTPLPSTPGPSKTQARPSNRGSDRKATQPSTPSSPSPSAAWRSTLEPSARLRVVDVQRAEPVEPDHAVEVVEHVAQPFGGADVVAAGEQVAGVQAGAAAACGRRRPRSAPPAPRTCGRACRPRPRCSPGAGRTPRSRPAPR